MRVYFRSGARGYHERGWYEFWTAYDSNGKWITVRVPEGKRDVYHRFAETDHEIFKNHVRVIRASCLQVVAWLSGHKKEPHHDGRYAIWNNRLAAEATALYDRLKESGATVIP